MSKKQKLDEVRKILLALLLARKGATPLPVLERDYCEMTDQRHIPYLQFGYPDLVGFLQSMPEHFIVEEHNGIHYIHGIASEKSKHVSSLVARQKTTTNHPKAKYTSHNLRQPSYNHRVQHMKSQQVKIAPDKLFFLMQYIKSNPLGVSLQNAVAFVQQLVPFINISTQELRTQLCCLSHQLLLDGNMIYPTWNNNQHNTYQQPLKEELQLNELPSNSASLPTTQIECAAGQEDFDCEQYFSDENDFVPVDHVANSHAETSEQKFATNFAQYANCEQTEMFDYNKVKNNTEINPEDFAINSRSNMELTIDCQDLSQIVNDRTKLRLKKLMQKNPEGIWCADLPNVYLHEYKVPLNYTQLGFASVREFTSYLPKIFYMTQINKADDFILFSADKRPVVPETDLIDVTQISHNRYDEHEAKAQCCNDDNAPIPSDVSSTITKNFAPKDVMNYNDNVKKILVTKLQCNKNYLEVYVVEVFHPNFFWIHLRENKKPFYKMMDELSDFYECNKNTYTIAKIALKKDMNCACVYMGRWHRGIIKSVKPDFRVTIFFYDYGTLKTYSPEDIYYLHKEFSSLPAQAIPCGLYNVKPNVSDRWKKSVIDKFIDKIADTLLAATIISVDPTYNSMMVILTDTTEDEDTVINNWLVNERLAQVGKTVRMFDIDYLRSNTTESYTSIRVFHSESAVNVLRHKNQSISRDQKTHRLSDVKSKDIENKTVKSLHNVPTDQKALLAKIWSSAKSLHIKSSSAESLNAKCPDIKSLNTKALDTKLQSRKCAQNEEFRTSPRKLEKLKTLSQKSNANSSTSSSETNIDNKNNARQIDSNRKVKSQNNKDDSCYMTFSLRDSDNENEEDFGTFRSLYGGHGLMEPFDWSLIREENNCPPETTVGTVLNNLHMSNVEKHENDVEDKSGSYNQKYEIPGKQYFLNMTRIETENLLPKNNIDYNVENTSDFMEMLRDKTTSSRIVKVIFTPNNKFKTSHSIQSEDTSKTNIVKLNDTASSREINQEVDRNSKMCKTRTDQKMKNRDFSTDSESVFSNTSNKVNTNREMSECNTNNFLESKTNNNVLLAAPKTIRQLLLDKIKQKKMDSSSNFFNSNEKSSSSDQILSSSYSCNTSNDTIISSNDEESNYTDANNLKTHDLVKELKSTSVELPKNQTLEESQSDSKGTILSSIETNFIASSNVDDIKQCRLNQSLKDDSLISSNSDDTKQHQLNQSSESDSIASFCNINDSKYQLNANHTALDVPKLKRQMLKIVQNIESNTELDSDDLSSSRESVKDSDDKSDESNGDDNNLIESNCVSEMFQSMKDDANVTEIAPPVCNDCDIESDESEWDAYAGSVEDFPFYIASK